MISLLMKEALLRPATFETPNESVNPANQQRTDTFSRFTNILTHPLRTYFEEIKRTPKAG